MEGCSDNCYGSYNPTKDHIDHMQQKKKEGVYHTVTDSAFVIPRSYFRSDSESRACTENKITMTISIRSKNNPCQWNREQREKLRTQ